MPLLLCCVFVFVSERLCVSEGAFRADACCVACGRKSQWRDEDPFFVCLFVLAYEGVCVCVCVSI